MVTRFIIFLVINFGALGIGGIFTGKGVPSDWYQNLNKAPWTPPGWVFGTAWTTIMVCFTFYMMNAWDEVNNRKILIGLFTMQWILNVLWNPIFFKYNQVLLALLIISSLTILIGFLLIQYQSVLKLKSLFLLPYFFWLLIATSLNAFIALKN
jgi:benzodiazapine receptor